MSNKIVVLTAPSGAGKSTIARRVLEAFPAMRFSVSATTRPRRQGEIDGVHYTFLSESEFLEAVENGHFLEYEEVYPGRYYGTPRSAVDTMLRSHHVLLDIDVNGAAAVKRAYDQEALVIFIRPPSMETLRDRLRGRRTETPETLEQRLRTAEIELGRAGEFDLIVVNDTLERAVAETISHIAAFINVGPAPGQPSSEAHT